MRIANVMFGRGLGGIEQAFLDYNEALLLAGHEVLAVTHPLAAINPEITGNLTHESLSNRGSWDIFAAHRLRKLYASWRPDTIISHGNRAIALNQCAGGAALKIGVTHNYQLRRFPKLGGVIAITEKLRDAAIAAGVAAEKIQLVPNMVRVPENPATTTHEPLVIGALGRMVEKKGFHLLMQAAAILRDRGIAFHLRLGGTGALEKKLKEQCAALGLNGYVTFVGWVEDKTAFFNAIDVFCLPSLHEPFGIVLLEAMSYGRPVIGFASEGPTEIIRHGEAMLVGNGNVNALAEALTEALTAPETLAAKGAKGREFVSANYALPVISQRLDAALRTLQPSQSKEIFHVG